MFNKDFENMLKNAGKSVEGFARDLSDFVESKKGEYASTKMQETLSDLGLLVPVSRVATYTTKENFVVLIALGKNYVSDSAKINVYRADQKVVVEASFSLTNDTGSINEKSVFEVTLPDNVLLEKPKSTMKNGDLEIKFQLKESADSINVNVND
jgi:HSP20 family molecular chaperone IbpA